MLTGPAHLVDRILAGDSGARALRLPDSDSWLDRGELGERIDALAGELADRGVAPGSRVAVLGPNQGPMLLALLAVLRHGGCVAPVNPALADPELAFAIGDSEATCMLAPADLAQRARTAIPEVPVIAVELDSQGRAQLGTPSAPIAGASDPGAALVLHTSGTTARPKRVEHDAGRLVTSAMGVAESCELSAEDVGLCVMPLFHVHGLVAGLIAPLLLGGAVAVSARFSASGFWPAVDLTGATWYTAVPTIHMTLLERADDDGAPPAGDTALRFARSSSSPFPPASQVAWERRFGIPVLEAYGMTEAAHQVCSNTVDVADRRAGSVGRPSLNDVAVLRDDGGISRAGDGELVIRGPTVFGGYAGNPKATTEAFVDGWFRTGDRGRLEDGFVLIIGRLKELINRGGEKISPIEVEAVLLEHVSVREAAAYAVPDAHYGEEVHAAVVLRAPATEAELLSHCDGRLAAFAHPKKVRMLDELPRNPTGKVMRSALAEG
jgi:acyl-CoA synthetase (AMP-forming)/AMP-acid ligase II